MIFDDSETSTPHDLYISNPLLYCTDATKSGYQNNVLRSEINPAGNLVQSKIVNKIRKETNWRKSRTCQSADKFACEFFIYFCGWPVYASSDSKFSLSFFRSMRVWRSHLMYMWQGKQSLPSFIISHNSIKWVTKSRAFSLVLLLDKTKIIIIIWYLTHSLKKEIRWPVQKDTAFSCVIFLRV